MSKCSHILRSWGLKLQHRNFEEDRILPVANHWCVFQKGGMEKCQNRKSRRYSQQSENVQLSWKPRIQEMDMETPQSNTTRMCKWVESRMKGWVLRRSSLGMHFGPRQVMKEGFLIEKNGSWLWTTWRLWIFRKMEDIISEKNTEYLGQGCQSDKNGWDIHDKKMVYIDLILFRYAFLELHLIYKVLSLVGEAFIETPVGTKFSWGSSLCFLKGETNCIMPPSTSQNLPVVFSAMSPNPRTQLSHGRLSLPCGHVTPII